MRDYNNAYNDIRSSSKIKLKNLIEELHNIYTFRVSYFQVINHYREQIALAGISYDKLELLAHGQWDKNIQVGKNTVILQDETENLMLVELIRYFVYCSVKKIKELEVLIDRWTLISIMPYHELFPIIKAQNKCIATHVLKGNVYAMPNQIGRIGIKLKKRNFDLRTINWGESRIYRDYLIANKLKPRPRGSNEGEPWLIFFTDDYYIKWVWQKSYCKVANAYFYTFKASNFSRVESTAKFEEQAQTVEDITDTAFVGTLQKSYMLSRKFKQINEMYHYGL